MQYATISLQVFGRHVSVSCTDNHVRSLISTGYGYMAGVVSAEPNLRYTVGQRPDGRGFFINRGGDGERLEADSVSDFLYFFEKDLTIELQRQRSDLYFIHAAAVESGGTVAMLVAPSGTGKSTTAFGLLHAGYRYLSDELAPVDLNTMMVQPYPHALCLKSEPPAPYTLPADTLRTGATMHVPVTALPSGTFCEPVPLGAIFFLSRVENGDTTVQSIETGEAAAWLYSNALNNLAHGGEGLDAAILLASLTPCFRLQLGDIARASGMIRSALEDSR